MYLFFVLFYFNNFNLIRHNLFIVFCIVFVFLFYLFMVTVVNYCTTLFQGKRVSVRDSERFKTESVFSRSTL